jgi:hypothetical protein
VFNKREIILPYESQFARNFSIGHREKRRASILHTLIFPEKVLSEKRQSTKGGSADFFLNAILRHFATQKTRPHSAYWCIKLSDPARRWKKSPRGGGVSPPSPSKFDPLPHRGGVFPSAKPLSTASQAHPTFNIPPSCLRAFV